MKKSTKVCLIIACICFVLGVIFCVSAVSVTGFKAAEYLDHVRMYGFYGDDRTFFNGSDEDYDATIDRAGSTSKEEFSTEGLTQIDMDIKYAQMSIEETSGNKIIVEMQGYIDDISCELKDGTLTIVDNRKNEGLWKNEMYTDIIVSIPKGLTFDNVDLQIDAGDVDINSNITAKTINLKADAGSLETDGKMQAEKMTLSVDAGELIVDEATADDLTISNGVGSVEFNGTVNKSADVDGGIGEIYMELDGRELDYNYSLECGIGEIQIEDQVYSSLGDERVVDNGSEKEIKLNCGVGRIDIQFE